MYTLDAYISLSSTQSSNTLILECGGVGNEETRIVGRNELRRIKVCFSLGAISIARLGVA
jgi:hypothetical protein